MDMNSSGAASGWLYDYGFDIPVAGADFMAAADSGGFSWGPQNHTLKAPSNTRLVGFVTFYSSFTFCFVYTLSPQTVLEHGNCSE